MMPFLMESQFQAAMEWRNGVTMAILSTASSFATATTPLNVKFYP